MSILAIVCRRNLFFGSDPKWAAFWDLWYFFNKLKRRFRVARPSTSATKMVNDIIIRKMNLSIFESSFWIFKVEYFKLQWSCCEVAFIPRLWYQRGLSTTVHVRYRTITPAYNHRQRTITAVSWLCYITYEICNFIRVKPMNKCSSFKMPLYRIQTPDFFSSLHIISLLNK